MPSGSLSPYGGELHALLRYLAAPEQKQQVTDHVPVDGPSWAKALAAYFKDYYPGWLGYRPLLGLRASSDSAQLVDGMLLVRGISPASCKALVCVLGILQVTRTRALRA